MAEQSSIKKEYGLVPDDAFLTLAGAASMCEMIQDVCSDYCTETCPMPYKIVAGVQATLEDIQRRIEQVLDSHRLIPAEWVTEPAPRAEFVIPKHGEEVKA